MGVLEEVTRKAVRLPTWVTLFSSPVPAPLCHRVHLPGHLPRACHSGLHGSPGSPAHLALTCLKEDPALSQNGRSGPSTSREAPLFLTFIFTKGVSPQAPYSRNGMT